MKRLVLIFIIAIVTFGCSNSAVVQEVTQSQAREVVVALYEHGILAAMEKQQGAKGTYTVTVSASKYGEALKILNDQNLPTAIQSSFTDFVGTGGIIPASREIESLRVDHAISLEIEDLLRRLPGVTSVRAVVRERAEINADRQGVAVVLSHKKQAQIVNSELTALISKVVPGIAADKITIQLIEDQPGAVRSGVNSKMVPFLWFTYVPEDDYKTLAIFFLGCVIVVGVASVLTGYWWGCYRRREQEGRNL